MTDINMREWLQQAAYQNDGLEGSVKRLLERIQELEANRYRHNSRWFTPAELVHLLVVAEAKVQELERRLADCSGEVAKQHNRADAAEREVAELKKAKAVADVKPHHMARGDSSTVCGAALERGNTYYEWAYVNCPDCLGTRPK